MIEKNYLPLYDFFLNVFIPPLQSPLGELVQLVRHFKILKHGETHRVSSICVFYLTKLR